MSSSRCEILVVESDAGLCAWLCSLIESDGLSARGFASGKASLAADHLEDAACLLVDVKLPDIDAAELVTQLRRRNCESPAIFMAGRDDMSLAIRAMKAGALDLVEKPPDRDRLMESVHRALAMREKVHVEREAAEAAARNIAQLSLRERQILEHLVVGKTNKKIASLLGISCRTVEAYRARLMLKLQARCLPDLVRIAFAAGNFAGLPPSRAEARVFPLNLGR